MEHLRKAQGFERGSFWTPNAALTKDNIVLLDPSKWKAALKPVRIIESSSRRIPPTSHGNNTSEAKSLSIPRV
jgi:hypothetical protein